MNSFALIGASGFVAPRHMDAIKKCGGNLICTFDPHDNIGFIDNYFPEAFFFTEFERFERFINKQNDENKKIDFLSICSPNYVHDTHIRFGIKNDIDVICEKPIVLNPWNLKSLIKLNHKSQNKIYNIFQLRLLPKIIELKKNIAENKHTKYEVNLTYITKRGRWYSNSWKGNINKSGGLVTNIGIHFFDLLIWLFGNVEDVKCFINNPDLVSGNLILKKANVKWFLSTNKKYLPKNHNTSFRELSVNDKIIDLSENFINMHYYIYKEILNGNGIQIDEAIPSLDLVYQIRNMVVSKVSNDAHLYLKKDFLL